MRLFFFFQKKKYGTPLEPTLIWGRRPKLFSAFLRLAKAFESKDSLLSPKLRASIMTKIAQLNHCAFCEDINSFSLIQSTKNEKALIELARFSESRFFSEKEKTALEYSEKITDSNSEVSDKLFLQIKNHFSDDEIVELTALIAFQNSSSMFNSALGISAHGFCKKS